MKLSKKQAIKKCLEMWKWICHSSHDLSNVGKVVNYKKQWCENNGYENKLVDDCFFCEYAFQKSDINCFKCPLQMGRYGCNVRNTSFVHNPRAFYKLLKEKFEKVD